MRLPNGYGSVYKLSGKRRKPFIARKTVGFDGEGKQLYQTVGYFETRKDALAALAQFNENPYSPDLKKLTFEDVFDRWKEQKFKDASPSSIAGYNAAFKNASNLHKLPFQQIKTLHLNKVITENHHLKHESLKKIKVLFSQLFKFSMQNDLIQKDYSKFVNIGPNRDTSTRRPFSLDEISVLFENVDAVPYVDSILILIFTGFRISELLDVRIVDIDVDNWTVRGGMKTEAGKDRLIPLNHKIIPLIKRRMAQGNEYLFSDASGRKLSYYPYYRQCFLPALKKLGMQHKPHDARHTFATLMSNADANKDSIMKLIGHNNYAITAKIYTHKDVEELRKAIDLI